MLNQLTLTFLSYHSLKMQYGGVKQYPISSYNQDYFIKKQSHKGMLDLQARKRIIDQSERLATRAEKITVTEAQFFQYLNKTQKSHAKFSQTIRAQVKTLQDSLQDRSYYSSDKLNLMKTFLKMQSSFFGFIEKVSIANSSDLTKIQSSITKCSEKSSKCENFMKTLNQYYNDSKNYNKKYSQYQANSGKLEQMILKYKQLQDPVNYYNPNKSTDITKNIQKNYQECENSQIGLINHLQLLEQKRKFLGQNMKNIRQQYIVFLHQRMQHIIEGAHCMTDAKKDDLYTSQKITYAGNNMLDKDSIFSEIIQAKPTNHQNAYQDDGLLSQIQAICANGRNSFTGSKSELKILEDRCKVFRNKIFDTTEQYTNFQRSFVEEINRQIALCEKNQKQFDLIFRQVFKIGGSSSNSQDNFFDKFNKYFGSSLFKIMNFCFHITDNPIKCISAIKRVFLQNDDKLRNMINQKEDQFKYFKKKVQFIRSEAKNDFKSQFSNSSLEENNKTLTKNLQNFKNIVQQFLSIQKRIDNQFNSSIIAMIQQIKIQSQEIRLSKIISKNQEGMDTLDQWNQDAQIVNLMKDDRKYDILFDDQSLGTGTKFKSLLSNKKCEKTKNVLKSKSIRIPPQTQVIKRASCCGGLSKKNNENSLYQVYVLKNKQKRSHGRLIITQKGVNFLQSKLNPFSQKLEFAIPPQQIKSYQRFKKQSQEGLQLNTFMGPVKIFSSQIQLLEQSLKSDLGIDQNFDDRIISKKQTQPNQQKNGKNGIQSQSKMDIKMDSRIYEKIFSKNNSRQNRSSQMQTATRPGSTIMQKISYDGSNTGNKLVNKGKSRTVSDDIILKNLYQQIRKTKYFSQNVKIVDQTNLNQFEYRLESQYYKSSIFEKRICQLNEYQKSLKMDIFWKIAFPQHPILRSFSHSESVKVQLKETLVKINVKQKSRRQMHLQFRKKFYEQVDKMNTNISNYVAQFCSRQGQVAIQQDPLQQSFMQSQISFNQDAKFSINSFSDYQRQKQQT